MSKVTTTGRDECCLCGQVPAKHVGPGSMGYCGFCISCVREGDEEHVLVDVRR
jgi:hypothetical protein